MIKYLKLSLLMFLSINGLLSAKTEDLRVSVIIPCYFEHVIYLEDLLKHYEAQTILPDEVVISVSEAEKVPKLLIGDLMNKKWAFPVRYVLSKKSMLAGENRNEACRVATGDIFITQDADDIPNPNRVEVVKFFFDKYKVDHLIHLFSSGSNFNLKELDNIDFVYLKNFNEIWRKAPEAHHGNIAIRRNVFEKIQWTNKPRGEDVEFNFKVYRSRKFKCIVVLDKLVDYRRRFSSENFKQNKP